VLITGLTVFLGVLLLLIKLPRRLMLRALHKPIWMDLGVSVTVLLVHWGTFSGVMAATVAGLLTSLASSAARRLIGFHDGTRYFPGVINLDAM